MAYCTQAEVTEAIGSTYLKELTDDAGSGSIDTGKFDRALVWASSIIDGFVQPVFAIPFVDVPNIINSIAVDLTVYRLFARRGGAFEIPEWINNLKKDAMSLLEKINKGLIHLDEDPQPSKSSSQISNTDGPERLFTEDTLERF